MSQIEVISEFDFMEFIESNNVYKKYIRKKGEAMVEIKEISIVDSKVVKVTLVKETFDSATLILVLKVENKTFNIPVRVKEVPKEDGDKAKLAEHSFMIEVIGKVLLVGEERGYQRVDVNTSVDFYTLKGRQEDFYKGFIQDISASGAKLITSRQLDSSNSILINTNFINLPFKRLSGKIVWMEKKEGKFHNGIHFQFKDDEEQKLLIEHLY